MNAESESKLKTVVTLMSQEIQEHPPTIGLIGVSGVGKSSTINSLFKTTLPTSDTVACTKEFENVDLGLEFQQGELKHQKTALRVFDAPGLGEDVAMDEQYLQMYKQFLPQCDVILWVMSARNRAIALDQHYLQQLSEFHHKIVFGINQVDIIEPINWNGDFNIPSTSQEDKMKEILSDRKTRLQNVLGQEPRVVCYSSRRGYNLELLFVTILQSCPTDRAWIFHGLKNFKPQDFHRVQWLGKDGVLSKMFSRSNK